MSVVVQVAEVKEVKSGNSSKGPWTLYHLIDGNGERYAIFSPSQKALYDAAKGLIGKRVELDYSEDDKGKQVQAISEAKAANGDTPPLGTGEYVTGQKPPIEVRRIFASTAWNNAAKLAELQFKVGAVTREITPDLVWETAKKYADQVFLDLLRKGQAMTEEDIPFEIREVEAA